MGANEDGPLLYIESSEGKEAGLEVVERFQRTIEEKCRVVGCPALADVDPSDRKMLEDGIGPSALESLVLAAGGARIVWTDDAIVAVLGREKFGTKRIWTQGVFRWLHEQGLMANDRYATVSASLLGMQYMFTSVNPEVMRCAGNRSDWRPERRPLKQALWYLSLDGVRAEDAALFAAMLVVHCYLDAVLPESRRLLLQSVAESLARRTDAERAVRLFGSVLRRAFGLNVAGMADATATFEAWRLEQVRRFSPVRR
ncbi:MAG: hypothetical protein ABSF69_28710 [Polyangiaceae bacterium]|jgi:TPR-GreAB-C-PIN type conflict system protein